MKSAIPAVAGLLIAAAASGPAAARSYACHSAVMANLMKFGITADRVVSTTVYGRSMSGASDDDEGVGVGYRFWMRMKGCYKGHLIVDTDFVCNVEQTFTDGPCKIAGVPDC